MINNLPLPLQSATADLRQRTGRTLLRAWHALQLCSGQKRQLRQRCNWALLCCNGCSNFLHRRQVRSLYEHHFVQRTSSDAALHTHLRNGTHGA